MATDGQAVATEYFDAWNARDRARFRALLATAVVWEGPAWRATGAEECMTAFDHASGTVSGVEVRRIWADGDDVIAWIDVHRADAADIPVANWMHLTDSHIDHIRATTDLIPSA